MTVILVLALFAAFVALDLGLQALRRRRAASHRAAAYRAAGEPPTRVVAGFRLPDGVGLHPRHTWARAVDPVTLLVGLDDFAARLVGPASGFVLPATGARLRAGEPALRVRSGTRAATVVSPVDGTLLEANAALDADPGLGTASPYGRGWLLRVRVQDAARSVGGLLRGEAAADWTRAESRRLAERLDVATGALADGGDLVPDFGAHLDRAAWESTVRRFLESAGRRPDDEEDLR